MSISFDGLMEERTFFDSASRTLLNASSVLAEPFCAVSSLYNRVVKMPVLPGEFGQCSTRTREIALRALIVAGAFFALAAVFQTPVLALSVALGVGIGSRALRILGFALQKDGFTYVRTRAIEIILEIGEKVKVLTFNVCGIGGGLSLTHGGVLHWRDRAQQIIQLVRDGEYHVVGLNEIYDTALAEAIAEGVQDLYPHIFMHLGPNNWGSVGGVMILSKLPVHSFANPSFTNNGWDLTRGYPILEVKRRPDNETPDLRIIATHLIHDNPENRREQVDEIINEVGIRTLLPTVIMGDLNIERDSEEAESTFRGRLIHGYTGNESTRTNRMMHRLDPKNSDPDEMIDYISLIREGSQGASISGCRILGVTESGLSDHEALEATIELPGSLPQ